MINSRHSNVLQYRVICLVNIVIDHMSLKQPYLYCGICFKKSNERTQFLTSCAHVICHEHINLNNKICPKCHVHDISIVKLEKGNIPESIKEIIVPNYEQLNNIQFASKFQYLQLVGLIEHYELQVSVLKEKNSRLKDLLRKSRVELDKCNEYQNEISRLREENERLSLKLQIGDSTTSKDRASNGDEINEITVEEYKSTSSRSRSRQRDRGIDSNKDGESEDFLSKMKKFNQLKSAEDVSKFNKPPVLNVLSQGRRGHLMDDMSSFNIQAESTTIRKKDRSMSMQLVPSKPNGFNDSSSISNSRNFFQGDISKMLSPMVSSTAGQISSSSGRENSSSTVNRDWYKKQSAYGRGIKNSNTSSNNSSRSGGHSGIIGAESNGGVKKLFNFKPPSRSISSRSGIKVGGQRTIGVLRSKSELFKR